MLPNVENLLLEMAGRHADDLVQPAREPQRTVRGGRRSSRRCSRRCPKRPIRFVVLRGRGGVFCSGGDLKMFRDVFQDGMPREQIVDFNAGFGRIMAAIRALPQLFVAVIEGAAMAGGLGIACLADVVITTADARFALTEVTLGIPPAQITPVVIQRIGAAEARRLLLTAQRFDGGEAQRLGFVHILSNPMARRWKRAWTRCSSRRAPRRRRGPSP
jgi:isohexenylglutaconyl-CoA hydratase